MKFYEYSSHGLNGLVCVYPVGPRPQEVEDATVKAFGPLPVSATSTCVLTMARPIVTANRFVCIANDEHPRQIETNRHCTNFYFGKSLPACFGLAARVVSCEGFGAAMLSSHASRCAFVYFRICVEHFQFFGLY